MLKSLRVLAVLGLGGTLLISSMGAPVPTFGAPTAEIDTSNCPVLEVDSPGPGDFLPSGDHLISGLAFDPNASEGSGVSRVDLFLGYRDSGGTYLGRLIMSEL